MRSYLSCLLAPSLGIASFAVDVSGKWNGNLEVTPCSHMESISGRSWR